MAGVVMRSLNKTFDGVHAVKDVNLEINDKEFVVLVGPSGCGKTTTLRMVAGLDSITSGEILIGDRVVNELPPMDRDIAMVFQNYALYPAYERLRQHGVRLEGAAIRSRRDRRARAGRGRASLVSRSSCGASRASFPAASGSASP
jgi:ABC-type sugar transport system ATPase subunit